MPQGLMKLFTTGDFWYIVQRNMKVKAALQCIKRYVILFCPEPIRERDRLTIFRRLTAP
ncbi:hypothetical protein FG93_03764 [Bosea sp. LC85]|nr:hypothetical protein FG93_03764 [Bosea sp. LC85]